MVSWASPGGLLGVSGGVAGPPWSCCGVVLKGPPPDSDRTPPRPDLQGVPLGGPPGGFPSGPSFGKAPLTERPGRLDVPACSRWLAFIHPEVRPGDRVVGGILGVPRVCVCVFGEGGKEGTAHRMIPWEEPPQEDPPETPQRNPPRGTPPGTPRNPQDPPGTPRNPVGYGLRVMGYGLRVTGCGLRVTGYGLWVTGWDLVI